MQKMEIYETKKSLYPPSIGSVEEIEENYHCGRSLRRTSNTRAIEERMSNSDIDIVNKWELRGVQKKVAGQQMKHHYAQFDILLKPYLRYTQAM